MDFLEFLKHGDRYVVPNLSIDLVVIGYRDGVLHYLLLKMGEKWLLPGGYIQKDESVDDAVRNILRQRTGLENAYLRFLSVFGELERRFGSAWKALLESEGLEWKEDYWFNDRFITLAYYALVNIENTHPTISHFDESFAWFEFDALPDMWMDHRSIVVAARERIREDVLHEYLAYHLLPDVFTMPELYELHQTILGEKIDRSRFQKKMLASGLFERLPKLHNNSPGRNPYQYRAKENNRN